MAWIESHQELARHPKTRKVARMLGVSVPAVIGHLHLFWWWAMDYAQDGNLGKYEPEDIADAAEWDGDSTLLMKALSESGFIDLCDDGSYEIHDWYEYVGRLIEKREADAERKRKSRKPKEDVQRTSNGQPCDGARNLTVPNHTLPNTPITREETDEDSKTYSNQAFENPHQNQIHIWVNECELDGVSINSLDDLFEFIGTVDIDVIGHAIKKSRNKHVNYAINTLKGLIKEGKITKESINVVPLGGNNAKPRASPTRRDNEFDRLSL